MSYHTVGAFLRASAKPDRSQNETVLTVSVATDEDGLYRRLSEVNLLWPDHAHPLDMQVVPGSRPTFDWSGAPDCDVQEAPKTAPDGIDDRGLALGEMYGYKPHDPLQVRPRSGRGIHRRGELRNLTRSTGRSPRDQSTARAPRRRARGRLVRGL